MHPLSFHNITLCKNDHSSKLNCRGPKEYGSLRFRILPFMHLTQAGLSFITALLVFGISQMFFGLESWTQKPICFFATLLKTKNAYYPTEDIHVLNKFGVSCTFFARSYIVAISSMYCIMLSLVSSVQNSNLLSEQLQSTTSVFFQRFTKMITLLPGLDVIYIEPSL